MNAPRSERVCNVQTSVTSRMSNRRTVGKIGGVRPFHAQNRTESPQPSPLQNTLLQRRSKALTRVPFWISMAAVLLALWVRMTV